MNLDFEPTDVPAALYVERQKVNLLKWWYDKNFVVPKPEWIKPYYSEKP